MKKKKKTQLSCWVPEDVIAFFEDFASRINNDDENSPFYKLTKTGLASGILTQTAEKWQAELAAGLDVQALIKGKSND